VTTDILEAPVEDKTVLLDRGEPGDADRFSHFAPKSEIDASWLNGTPVTALCGKKWIPTRDPMRFPICPKCKAIHDNPANFLPEDR
jgi:hypothetical protein